MSSGSAAAVGRGHLHAHRAGIDGARGVGAELHVDRRRHARGRGEIGLVQGQLQRIDGTRRQPARATCTSAPRGTRPTVRWLTGTELPPPPAPKPPSESGPCASATTLPSGPRSGVGISVPPCRLRASPIDEATTSMRAPVCAYGPIWAVTITAAMFSTLIASGDTVTPKRSSMLASVCAEKIVWRRSPVLFRPTTRP